MRKLAIACALVLVALMGSIVLFPSAWMCGGYLLLPVEAKAQILGIVCRHAYWRTLQIYSRRSRPPRESAEASSPVAAMGSNAP